jgi:hypothetical protein
LVLQFFRGDAELFNGIGELLQGFRQEISFGWRRRETAMKIVEPSAGGFYLVCDIVPS